MLTVLERHRRKQHSRLQSHREFRGFRANVSPQLRHVCLLATGPTQQVDIGGPEIVHAPIDMYQYRLRQNVVVPQNLHGCIPAKCMKYKARKQNHKTCRRK